MKAGDVEAHNRGHKCEDIPIRQMRTIWWVVLCSLVLLGVMQAALDVTITANLQPTILHALGEVEKLPFMNVAFALANAGSSPLWGKILDSFDSKKIFISARVIFAIGSIVSAAAPSMNGFIIGKAITGLGAGGTYLGSISILNALTSDEERPRYFSYLGFVWGIGTIVGPMIGGGFAITKGGWRWSFYFDAILVGASILALVFLLPSHCGVSRSHLPVQTRLKRLDILGATLFAGALTTSIIAFASAGILFSWRSGQVIGLFCGTGVLWALFALQQGTATFTNSEDRILPLHVLSELEMWILTLQVICAFGIVYAMIYYIPLYLQFVRAESALRSAIHMLPFLIPTVVSMLLSGRLVASVARYKVWFLVGSGLALIGSGLWYNVTSTTPHVYLYCSMVLGGTGLGLYGMSPAPIMAARVEPRFVSDTGTVFGCADTLSGAIPVAVANTIFINCATVRISRILQSVSKSTIQAAIAGVGAAFLNDLQDDQKDRVLQAISSAFRDVGILLIALAAFSFAMSLMMRLEKLSYGRSSE